MRFFKVKGAGPERFLIAFVNSELSLTSSYIMTTAESLSESEVRTELAKMGRTEVEIDSVIQEARKNPR